MQRRERLGAGPAIALAVRTLEEKKHCIVHNQAWSKPILIGQAIWHMSSRGVWGHAPPENF